MSSGWRRVPLPGALLGHGDVYAQGLSAGRGAGSEGAQAGEGVEGQLGPWRVGG